MRIVALKGGLGNQLFQYAYGKYLNKQGFEVAYNIDWFKTFKNHEFLLCQLVPPNMILSDSPVTDDGYWQELKYTDPVKTNLLQDIKPDDEIDAIAMHIRRTDYIGHKTFVNLGMDYYDKAYIKIGNDDLPVLIFSDDPDWCEKHTPRYPNSHVVLTDPVASFRYMRRCKHKIIANSTFSWWAAYLSYSGTTIAPVKWWTDKSMNYENNLLPNHWTTL